MANYFSYKDKLIKSGDTVAVSYKLIEREIVAGKAKREKKEETRERIQVFEGIVIKIRGHGDNKSFTVRKIGGDSIGVERIFPLISPWIKNIRVKKHAKVRRAKLYYLRQKVGKQAQKLKGTKIVAGADDKTKEKIKTDESNDNKKEGTGQNEKISHNKAKEPQEEKSKNPKV